MGSFEENIRLGLYGMRAFLLMLLTIVILAKTLFPIRELMSGPYAIIPYFSAHHLFISLISLIIFVAFYWYTKKFHDFKRYLEIEKIAKIQAYKDDRIEFYRRKK